MSVEQANWDFAANKNANLRGQDVGGGAVKLCQLMKSCAGQWNQGGKKEELTERGVKGAGCI